MWMASATYWPPARRTMAYAYRWPQARVDRGARILARVLDGVGEEAHERLCVNATALIHSRRLTDEEIDAAGLRGACAIDPAGMPLRIVWERGESYAASTQPCEHGGVEMAEAGGARFPQATECGRCRSCVARAALCPRKGPAR